MEDVVAAVRTRSGPVLVEAATYRWHGHYEGDPERYRSTEEVREWEGRDPLVVHERRLRAAGVGDDEIKGAGVVGGRGSSTPRSRRPDSSPTPSPTP